MLGNSSVVFCNSSQHFGNSSEIKKENFIGMWVGLYWHLQIPRFLFFNLHLKSVLKK